MPPSIRLSVLLSLTKCGSNCETFCKMFQQCPSKESNSSETDREVCGQVKARTLEDFRDLGWARMRTVSRNCGVWV